MQIETSKDAIEAYKSFDDWQYADREAAWKWMFEAGQKAERERICARIKAEDDHCSTADYLLDSDDGIAVAAEAQGILHATLYAQENAPSFSGSPGDYASIEKAATLLNDISKEPALPVFDADNPRFRQVFDEAVHAHNLPSTRKGDGYRSPITQWCFLLAYSVVNRLRLYEK